MTKICFFVGNISQAGGTERVTTVIGNGLQAREYDVHILSLQCDGEPFFPVSEHINIDRLFLYPGRGAIRLPLIILKLRSYLKENNIDVLIDVESMLSLYTVPAVMGLNIRHICWEHFNFNVDLGKTARRFARKLAAYFADDVITLTEQDKMLWLSNTNYHAKITAIPNPVTISLPEKINNNKEKLFLAVGRLTHQKGFDLLLQAWALIAPLYPEWRLRIVGDGEDKPMLEKLRRDLNVEISTELAPNTKNIAEHYQQATYFILSSRFEGFGLVVVEAQAYGLPVISFDCELGPSEIILHDKTGWLCEPENIFSLSERIKFAIENDNNYERLSQASMCNAARYSIDNTVEKWVELIG
ncbi:glycosyltransferase family 4 protein [Aeromonas caviae]